MSEVDSDGFPVSPWHSRFVEISEGDPAMKRFVEAVGRGLDRMIEFAQSSMMTGEQMRALALLFESHEREARTRRVVQAQRRRRHR
jgi:hypothetical protein